MSIVYDDDYEEAVRLTREWYRAEKSRFVIELPGAPDRLLAIEATIEELLHPWEQALVITEQELPGKARVTVCTTAHMLHQRGLYAIVFIDDCRGAYVPLYRQLVRERLHPYGLCIGYTDDYRREKGLQEFFSDGLCYFTVSDKEFERGMRFFEKVCREKSLLKVLPKTAKTVFASPTYEQDVVWDGMREQEIA